MINTKFDKSDNKGRSDIISNMMQTFVTIKSDLALLLRQINRLLGTNPIPKPPLKPSLILNLSLKLFST